MSDVDSWAERHAKSSVELRNNLSSLAAPYRGHFSTVWMCSDRRSGAYVALKVQKSAEHYTEAAWDEIDILKTVHTKAVAQAVNDVPVVQLLDYFLHTGPNGSHVCFVFEMLVSPPPYAYPASHTLLYTYNMDIPSTHTRDPTSSD